MKKPIKFKVGTKIIEAGRVYRVFKIEDRKYADKEDKFIYYKPYFKNKVNRSIVCSVPLSNLNKTTIRKPSSKEKVKEIIKFLETKTDKTDSIDNADAKEVLKENKIKKTALVAKKYWKKKHNPDEKLSFSQRRTMQNAIDYLSQEIALVNNISLEKAEELISNKLAK